MVGRGFATPKPTSPHPAQTQSLCLQFYFQKWDTPTSTPPHKRIATHEMESAPNPERAERVWIGLRVCSGANLWCALPHFSGNCSHLPHRLDLLSTVSNNSYRKFTLPPVLRASHTYSYFTPPTRGRHQLHLVMGKSNPELVLQPLACTTTMAEGDGNREPQTERPHSGGAEGTVRLTGKRRKKQAPEVKVPGSENKK